VDLGRTRPYDHSTRAIRVAGGHRGPSASRSARP
jgi:hypothetical protein